MQAASCLSRRSQEVEAWPEMQSALCRDARGVESELVKGCWDPRHAWLHSWPHLAASASVVLALGILALKTAVTGWAGQLFEAS